MKWNTVVSVHSVSIVKVTNTRIFELIHCFFFACFLLLSLDDWLVFSSLLLARKKRKSLVFLADRSIDLMDTFVFILLFPLKSTSSSKKKERKSRKKERVERKKERKKQTNKQTNKQTKKTVCTYFVYVIILVKVIKTRLF